MGGGRCRMLTPSSTCMFPQRPCTPPHPSQPWAYLRCVSEYGVTRSKHCAPIYCPGHTEAHTVFPKNNKKTSCKCFQLQLNNLLFCSLFSTLQHMTWIVHPDPQIKILQCQRATVCTSLENELVQLQTNRTHGQQTQQLGSSGLVCPHDTQYVWLDGGWADTSVSVQRDLCYEKLLAAAGTTTSMHIPHKPRIHNVLLIHDMPP